MSTQRDSRSKRDLFVDVQSLAHAHDVGQDPTGEDMVRAGEGETQLARVGVVVKVYAFCRGDQPADVSVDHLDAETVED